MPCSGALSVRRKKRASALVQSPRQDRDGWTPTVWSWYHGSPSCIRSYFRPSITWMDGYEFKNDPCQFVRGGCDGFRLAWFGSHPPNRREMLLSCSWRARGQGRIKSLSCQEENRLCTRCC